MRSEKHLRLQPVAISASPRSELSPTTTNTSSPTFDTPPAKTRSSSGLSDTPTPPSPPISDKSTTLTKPVLTPGIPKPRLSMTNGTSIQRPSTAAATTRPNGHVRGPSVPAFSRTGPSSSFRQSLSKPGNLPPRPAGLSQSASIIHLRNLRGKMQKLEERVQTARSKLPAPVNTPPKVSPRSGSALGNHIPASVTVRSRKRTGGSLLSGPESLPDNGQGTPSIPRSRPSRQSLSQHPPPSPTKGEMAAPPPLRPASRASGISGRSSFAPSHSRPGSRASVSGFRAGLSSGVASHFAPNASTDRIRSKSSLSNYGYDGALDEENDEAGSTDVKDTAIRTPRRTTFSKRTSDIGSAIPSPTKRPSIGGIGGVQIKPSGLGRRQSSGFVRVNSGSVPAGEMRSPSRQLNHVQEGYDVNETF